MDIRDKKISWRDQEVFDIPEAAGVTASGDFLVVIRDKLIEQLNHLTIVNQFIPDLQKEVSILDIYLNRGGEKPKVRQWETDRITKQKELDDRNKHRLNKFFV